MSFLKRGKYITISPSLLVLFCLCVGVTYVSRAQQLKVYPSRSALELAQTLTGPGVTVLNPVLDCPAQAEGAFSILGSNLGLDSGIVLTTGRVASSGAGYGLNGFATYLASNDLGSHGDSSLNVLAGQTTMDACKLEFDVIPFGDTISINYVFSSEEYKNAVCGPYNDAFAFFISGAGISGTDNMALVPGTNIPVTINSINNGTPGSSGNIINCTAMGPGSPFTAYYVDNSAGHYLTHHGFTTVLQAMHPVKPCKQYHLKIVIADAGDPLYDSGVFLEAGSLQSETYNIKPVANTAGDTAAPFCVKGCLNGLFRIKASRVKSQAQTIHFIRSGTAVSGVDYTSFPDSVVIPAFGSSADVIVKGLPTSINGAKTLRLSILSPGSCTVSQVIDSAMMVIYDTLHFIVLPRDTIICGGDTVQMQVAGDSIYSWHWFPGTGLSADGIKEPVAFPVTDTRYTLTASLPGTSCPSKSSAADITIKLTPTIAFISPDTTVCYKAIFQFLPLVTPVNSYYSYRWTGPDAFADTVPNPTLPHAMAKNSGTYKLEVINDTNGCKAIASLKLNVFIPDSPVVKSPTIICQNTMPEALSVGTNNLWYTNPDSGALASAPVIPTDVITSMQYFVTQLVNGCESPASGMEVEVKKCCDGNIRIPTGFTPNNDGMNDHFNIVEDYGYFIKRLTIYDRWGQIIYTGNSNSWDGNYGQTPAEVGTYFYRVVIGCILGGFVERVGDVTLIR